MKLEIIEVNKLPENFEKLIKESVEEGHNFVSNTKKEWLSGKNSFSQNSECFFLAYDDDTLIGCGGVNIDPYTVDKTIGRVRHLYISPQYRRRGIARRLINKIINKSKISFSVLRLRANTVDLGSNYFYLSCGFIKTEGDEFETHRIQLK